MEQRATIREVAAYAGVSPSTVSRVLNERVENHMRPETKERVLDAIRVLNYTPVKAAQTLRRQRTRTLGVLIPDIANLYFALLTRGVESVAFERGFTTLICDSNCQKERESRYLDIFLAEGVEGILFVPVGLPDERMLRRLMDQGINIVVVDRRLPDLPTVEAENREASRELAEHILGLGYRRIGYIAGPADVSTSQDRLAGFLDALRAEGIEPAVVQRGDFTFEAGFDCALRILEEVDVEAIVAANDLMAFGVLRAAEDRGRPVPKDLGVAGFDHVPHVPYATFMHPELTTVEVPVREMGSEAVRLLLEGTRDSMRMATRLIRGGTCRELGRRES
jgi:LacI family transcriptional regulator